MELDRKCSFCNQIILLRHSPGKVITAGSLDPPSMLSGQWLQPIDPEKTAQILGGPITLKKLSELRSVAPGFSLHPLVVTGTWDGRDFDPVRNCMFFNHPDLIAAWKNQTSWVLIKEVFREDPVKRVPTDRTVAFPHLFLNKADTAALSAKIDLRSDYRKIVISFQTPEFSFSQSRTLSQDQKDDLCWVSLPVSNVDGFEADASGLA